MPHLPHDYFIALAGNIGAGKSSLARRLAEAYGWTPFYEANAENPYLADFYEDMPRWSFHSQVFFLGKRLEHHRRLLDHPGTVVQDRTVYEDAEIFARNLHDQGYMSARDFAVYCGLYQAVRAFLPPPDLVVYLRASTPTLLRHIQGRGRDYERSVAPGYIAQLNMLYEAWITAWAASPVVVLDMDMLDFVAHDDHLAEAVARIHAALPHRPAAAAD